MAHSELKQALQAETGKSHEEWIMLLDQEAETSWSHEEIVGHLQEVCAVHPKWSELIASSFEQKIGRKPVGQTAEVGFQIGVRRSLPISQEQAWRMLTSPDILKLWLGSVSDLTLEKGHVFRTEEGVSGELRVVKPMEQLRLTWQKPDWSQSSTLQIRLLSKQQNRTTVSFHQEKLADLFVREEMKEKWEDVLAKMKEKSLD
ncbi:activator of Hsp90 ATPase-like protein [Tumebacillus sp. BK434]|uniref:SRPBCC family protein n=1 Tax=Tumebacillus sp. BK434 TaxID=2512169 RepID=UPI0010D58523|nr:SRPBCC domain-containing protein [Tumebacillus sp. BK434]TCP52591.1 activator of Hsp90 ATPase-like protein [Tumebacillus sp. BK434]